MVSLLTTSNVLVFAFSALDTGEVSLSHPAKSDDTEADCKSKQLSLRLEGTNLA
jgi:hypothetical protein